MHKEIASMIGMLIGLWIAGMVVGVAVYTINIDVNKYSKVCSYKEVRIDKVFPFRALGCWFMEPVDQEDKQ